MITDSIDLGTEGCSECLQVWDTLCTVLERSRRLLIFADFDGTLSELVSAPHQATLDRDARDALRRLASTGAVTLVIMSGRSVQDVAERVGLPAIYGGDHGIEMHGPDVDFLLPEAVEFRRQVPELSNHLREALSHIRGVLVEAKRFSASVHYRQARSEDTPEIRGIVDGLVNGGPFHVRNGSRVFEVRPRLPWGKGNAARWLLQSFRAHDDQAICIGDDETDEDMFAALPGAVNVRVVGSTDAATQAKYYVNRSGVATFLHGVADLVEGILISTRECEQFANALPQTRPADESNFRV